MPISFSQVVSTSLAGTPASGAQPSANAGQHIRVLGAGLDITTEVIFPTINAAGAISNVVRTPTFVKADGTEIEVRVPDNALTGNIRVVGATGTFPPD